MCISRVKKKYHIIIFLCHFNNYIHNNILFCIIWLRLMFQFIIRHFTKSMLNTIYFSCQWIYTSSIYKYASLFILRNLITIYYIISTENIKKNLKNIKKNVLNTLHWHYNTWNIWTIFI